jgi:regulator of PEP synthase PpsR (kinase-PPPase family)
LGFRIVLVSRSPESFEAARAERLKVSGKPDQYNDLGIFIEEQMLMRRLVGQSILPWTEIDVSHNDVPRTASAIADWLEATGGLWMAR